MACDLSDPALKDAYDEIRLGSSECCWLIAGYKDSKDVITLYEKGSNGFDEMREKVISRDEVLYVYVRLESKHALITYISDKATGVRRARALVHGRAVGNMLKENNISVTLTAASELTEANFRSKLRLDAQDSSLIKSKSNANVGARIRSAQNSIDELNNTGSVSPTKKTPDVALNITQPQDSTIGGSLKHVEPPRNISSEKVSLKDENLTPPITPQPSSYTTTIEKPASLEPSPIAEMKPIIREKKPSISVASKASIQPEVSFKKSIIGVDVEGYINYQKGAHWKRCLYSVSNGTLTFLSNYPRLTPIKTRILANLAGFSRADSEIIIKNSLKLTFMEATEEFKDLNGQDLFVYFESSEDLQKFLKFLK